MRRRLRSCARPKAGAQKAAKLLPGAKEAQEKFAKEFGLEDLSEVYVKDLKKKFDAAKQTLEEWKK